MKNKRVGVRILAAGLFVFLLFSAACGGKEVAWHSQAADLDRFPQNLEAYIEPGKSDVPLVSKAEQDAAGKRYKKMFFKPWSQKKSAFPAKDAAWASRHYSGKGSWTQAGERVPPDFWAGVIANANIKKFPSLAWKGILTENAPLRALPTFQPYYNHPDKSGEGYPFDYMAYVTLWVGTPVFVSHISEDEQWLFCETALVSGWMPAEAVSPVNESLIRHWKNLPLAAIVKDKLPAAAGRGNVGSADAGDLRIGAILPRQGADVLLPVPRGAATGWQRISLPAGAVENFPMPLTAGNVARLGNEMMGEPYGWGGIDYLRDCSSMLHDLFSAFGLWLPRNSAQQIRVGRAHDISAMSPNLKEKNIKDFGVPFRTLVGMPGHVMLYIGEYEGYSLIYHDMWGIHTVLDDGSQGRLIIGKVVVTSLRPGEERPEVRRAKSIPERLKGFTVIP